MGTPERRVWFVHSWYKAHCGKSWDCEAVTSVAGSADISGILIAFFDVFFFVPGSVWSSTSFLISLGGAHYHSRGSSYFWHNLSHLESKNIIIIADHQIFLTQWNWKSNIANNYSLTLGYIFIQNFRWINWELHSIEPQQQHPMLQEQFRFCLFSVTLVTMNETVFALNDLIDQGLLVFSLHGASETCRLCKNSVVSLKHSGSSKCSAAGKWRVLYRTQMWCGWRRKG